MRKSGKLFYLYKRNNIKSSVWYVKFRMADGSISVGMSSHETSKPRAERWAFEQIQSGITSRKPHYENMLFKDFTIRFFDWDGRWATDKRASGRRISKRHCKERSDLLKNHLLPSFSNFKIEDISRTVIKDFRNELFEKGYSGNTINKILSALKAILELAEELEIIDHIPTIERAADRPKSKGILTLSEIKELFGPSVRWNDHRCLTANILAATSGLRLGEILALHESDISFTDHLITISKSWDVRLRQLNHTTKNGRDRKIVVTDKTLSLLRELLEMNPYRSSPDRFVFYGHISTQPITPDIIRHSLDSALEQIGIGYSERVRRNITFHSWRHYLNSFLINERIPLQKIQSITGHLTIDMTQHYYHADEMNDVLNAQKKICAS